MAMWRTIQPSGSISSTSHPMHPPTPLLCRDYAACLAVSLKPLGFCRKWRLAKEAAAAEAAAEVVSGVKAAVAAEMEWAAEAAGNGRSMLFPCPPV
mmetsp:Transcript_33967/g.76905  ORF Transcript_33967/g.76905 Transcript_33967/m.76905 type:complete len:96 (-) Transcript_33967:205-492(-)